MPLILYMQKFFLIILFSSLTLKMYGQLRAPKYSNEFLAIGVGARALGMSGTQVAIVNDVTSGYWNPAGLIRVKDKYQVSLMHAEYFAGIAKYDYLAFTTAIDSVSKLGVSVIRFGVDDIPNTLNLFNADGSINYDKITFFASADYAFLFSYARKSQRIKGLNFGANLKIIHRVVGNFGTAWGFGFDVGLQYQRRKWQLGAVVKDITGTFNAWSYNSSLLVKTFALTANVVPENSIEVTLPQAILGVGRSFTFGRKFGLIAGIDLNVTFDGRRNNTFSDVIKSNLVSIDPKGGFEVAYNKIAFLRFGVGNIQKIKNFDKTYKTTFQPNFGVGFKLSKFTIDYALTDIGDKAEALYSNVFSIKAGF